MLTKSKNNPARGTPLLQAKAVHLLIALACASVTLLAIPFLLERQALHLSLMWNLLLAALPMLFCLPLLARETKGKRGPLSVLWWTLWVVFFPNAPYLLTDLIHVGIYNYYSSSGFLPGGRAWLGLFHIAAVVAVGCVFGCLSLYQLHGLVTRRHGAAKGWLFCAAVCCLSGIGLYIGRFMRFNSWDVVRQPLALLGNLAAQPPLRTAAFCLLFTAMALGAYLLFFLCYRDAPPARDAPDTRNE